MSLSTGASSLISSSVSTVADYFLGKGTRDAQKKAAAAQQHLFDLQAQEQDLRNRALAMSISDQNSLVPFANSLASSSLIRGVSHGVLPQVTTAGIPDDALSLPTTSTGTYLLIGALLVGVFLIVKARR